MQELDLDILSTVCGGESLSSVLKAASVATNVPSSQAYGATLDFIRDHPFFHQGVMDLPIGGGKHFRNVPFVGPSRIAKGLVHGNGETIAQGVQITRATWDAP